MSVGFLQSENAVEQHTVRQEKHLHAKYTCAAQGLDGPFCNFLSARCKLRIPASKGCEYKVTDIILMNSLHDRIRTSLPHGSKHNHDGDLLDKRHPLLRVERTVAEEFEGILGLR